MRSTGRAPAWSSWGPYLVAFQWPNDQPDTVLRGYDNLDRAQHDVDRGNHGYQHDPYYVKENEHWHKLAWWQRRKL